MDPGEQTTGTRDEHYNLISVLYHALHGAENCEMYTMDAEAAGRDELAAFFREAQVMHAALAEQAKGRLGIGGTTPGDIAGEVLRAVPRPEAKFSRVVAFRGTSRRDRPTFSKGNNRWTTSRTSRRMPLRRRTSPRRPARRRGRGRPRMKTSSRRLGTLCPTPRPRVTTLRHRRRSRGGRSRPTPRGRKTPAQDGRRPPSPSEQPTR